MYHGFADIYMQNDVQDDGFLELMADDGSIKNDVKVPDDEFEKKARDALEASEKNDTIVCKLKPMSL
jgi:translation initiation factor 5A